MGVCARERWQTGEAAIIDTEEKKRYQFPELVSIRRTESGHFLSIASKLHQKNRSKNKKNSSPLQDQLKAKKFNGAIYELFKEIKNYLFCD